MSSASHSSKGLSSEPLIFCKLLFGWTMPSLRAWFFRWALGMANARMTMPTMNIPKPPYWHQAILRWVSTLICLSPAILSAHPGHDHPDETDEFDFLQAAFFHSHGSLDYLLAAVMVFSIVLVCQSGRPLVRVGAAMLAVGSLAMLPIF